MGIELVSTNDHDRKGYSKRCNWYNSSVVLPEGGCGTAIQFYYIRFVYEKYA
ncbi:hypothetical protein BDZ91DRAFT_737783 [Kalaharituber pfeilii]|nr:hypothetical protein BDZ91DRAFT_737783 [Kalaharituber pfeilii]